MLLLLMIERNTYNPQPFEKSTINNTIVEKTSAKDINFMVSFSIAVSTFCLMRRKKIIINYTEIGVVLREKQVRKNGSEQSRAYSNTAAAIFFEIFRIIN